MSLEPKWRRLAAHEAGHAVAAVLLGVEVGVMYLDPPRGHGGTTTRITDPWTDSVILMAGVAAVHGPGFRSDYQTAVSLVGEDRVQAALDSATALLDGHDLVLIAVAEALLAMDGGELEGARVTAIVREMIPDAPVTQHQPLGLWRHAVDS